MNALLDTHALIWALAGDDRLSTKAREEYEGSGVIFFSVVSLWEIGVKLALQRPDFALAKNWWKEIPKQLVAQGVKRLDIEPEHCLQVSRLPLHHRDPFDRMLIAQALCQKASIISIDEKFDDYSVKRIW
jgi:PIN domain nuclease of toxin-antitoxin system